MHSRSAYAVLGGKLCLFSGELECFTDWIIGCEGKTTICACVTFKRQSKATWVFVAERPAASQRTKESGTVDLFVYNKQTEFCHHEHLFVTNRKARNATTDPFAIADNGSPLKFLFFTQILSAAKENLSKSPFEGKVQNVCRQKFNFMRIWCSETQTRKWSFQSIMPRWVSSETYLSIGA